MHENLDVKKTQYLFHGNDQTRSSLLLNYIPVPMHMVI